MAELITVGVLVLVAVFMTWLVWQMCRAAKQMDEAYDRLDQELANRANKRPQSRD